MRVAAMLGGLALAAAGMVAVAPAAVTGHVIEARPIPASPQTPKAPAPTQDKAIRETREARSVRYSRGIPASIKNRGPGERAHRRWRKSRSAGSAA